MIKSLLTASLAIMLSVNTALALSCIRPDPARSFTKAAESEDRYVVLLGTFALPDDFTQPDGRTIKQSSAVSRFSGRLMTGEGFNEEVSADLTIELSCSGDWCGDIKPDTTYLAYVLQLSLIHI